MVVPFGFSAGDFAAGIHLIHKVVVSLRDSEGASADFTLALSEVEDLVSLLAAGQKAVQRPEFIKYSSDNVETLRAAAHKCHIRLAPFFRKLKKLESDLLLCSGSKASLLQSGTSTARKVHWDLQLRKEVGELKAAILPHLGEIQVMLQLIGMYETSCEIGEAC
jgi:hypothetical protein